MVSEICETDLQNSINYSLNSERYIQQFLNCAAEPNSLGMRSPAQSITAVHSPSQAKTEPPSGKKLPKATLLPTTPSPRIIPVLCQGIATTFVS